ncbi:MerR family transcriptional regulator [Ureibacillus massiliensis 4400831 = CIP 108448 = CCUG 49529]|uniref:MerR family transcriptional regulator n=1 Tax=Ureibacillus massiliensis 4400831 = CIP 108448 = CCUG 49529 TaxID=1211035 RepID=A0A0A3JXG6_9BACL|nr:MerR family transcriptional regulator [Ureibacillus massiliensis]KGR91702.1 MerR family transcriptional regulator [Ureibacillus massiliensis 4400831 = CIP 108448 = CCUG 49529]
MEVTIGQFAKLVGSTVRTLRYYDKIGLLTPKNLNQNGRKVYTRLDWEIFQKIVIFKNLGLSLSEIKEQLTNEKLSNRELLLVQKQLITRKQEELNDILEVITRMDRLYNLEGISEEELDEFAFIMLDLFMREKRQIQALEEYFIADKQLMKEIKLLHDPEYKMKMDRETWHLIQAIKNAIQYNDSTSRKKVRDILNNMDNIFPASRNFLSLINDDIFFAKYNQEFNNYFPENIARYIYNELKTYYDDKENSEGKDNNE